MLEDTRLVLLGIVVIVAMLVGASVWLAALAWVWDSGGHQAREP